MTREEGVKQLTDLVADFVGHIRKKLPDDIIEKLAELSAKETLWCSKVKEFGPLIVSIDTQGRNLFEENKIIFNKKKEAAKQAIYPEVKFIR